MIEKLVEIGILFDFYGKLLNDRQYLIVELYYIYDFSLAEIGEELNISRQAVYDMLKRSEQKLYEYENVLGLVEKFNSNKEKIKDIAILVDEIENESKKNGNIKILEKIEELKSLIGKVIENS